jgi:hypothetical protein
MAMAMMEVRIVRMDMESLLMGVGMAVRLFIVPLMLVVLIVDVSMVMLQ